MNVGGTHSIQIHRLRIKSKLALLVSLTHTYNRSEEKKNDYLQALYVLFDAIWSRRKYRVRINERLQTFQINCFYSIHVYLRSKLCSIGQHKTRCNNLNLDHIMANQQQQTRNCFFPPEKIVYCTIKYRTCAWAPAHLRIRLARASMDYERKRIGNK